MSSHPPGLEDMRQLERTLRCVPVIVLGGLGSLSFLVFGAIALWIAFRVPGETRA